MPDQRDLSWLLESLAAEAPGIQHVLVLSKDGLKVSHTPGLDHDKADQLAAIAAGIQSLAKTTSHEFGDGSGDSGQTLVECGGVALCIVPAGQGAHLAVLAAQDADIGLVGYSMNELVDRIGGYLTAEPRQPAHGAPT